MGLLEEYGIEKGGFLADKALVAEAHTALAQVWGELTDQPAPFEAGSPYPGRRAPGNMEDSPLTAQALIYELKPGLTLEAHLRDASYDPKEPFAIYLVSTCLQCGSKGEYAATQYWRPVTDRDPAELSRALELAMEHPGTHRCLGQQVVEGSAWAMDPGQAMVAAVGETQKAAGHRMREYSWDIVDISTTVTHHTNDEGYTATCVIALRRK